MKESSQFFILQRFCKGPAESQADLTQYYRRLFGEQPTINSIIGGNGEDGAVVFDGDHWWDVDMASLLKECSDPPE